MDWFRASTLIVKTDSSATLADTIDGCKPQSKIEFKECYTLMTSWLLYHRVLLSCLSTITDTQPELQNIA